MPVALPYDFDTTGTPKILLRGVVVVLGFVIVSGLISIGLDLAFGAAGRGTVAKLLSVALVAPLLAGFGFIVLRKIGGASGTITAQEVTVTPFMMMGFKSDAPEGTFAISRFGAVRVERISGRQRNHERVYLAGRDGTPDICVAETARGAGVTLGNDLATALSLTVNEVRMPY